MAEPSYQKQGEGTEVVTHLNRTAADPSHQKANNENIICLTGDLFVKPKNLSTNSSCFFHLN